MTRKRAKSGLEREGGAETTNLPGLETARANLRRMVDEIDARVGLLIEETREEILGCPIDDPILPDGIRSLDEIEIINTFGILEGYIPFKIEGCDLPAGKLCKLIREITIDGDKRRHFYRYRVRETGQEGTFCSDELREKLISEIAKLKPLPPAQWQTATEIWREISKLNKEVSSNQIRQRANKIAGDDQKGIYRRKGSLKTYAYFAPEVIRALYEKFAPALIYEAAPAGADWKDIENLATELEIIPQELLEISEKIEGEMEKPQKYLSPDGKRAVLHFSPQTASQLRTCIENLCAPPGWQSKEEILEELKIWIYGDTRKGIIEEALEDLERTDNEKTYLNKTIRRRAMHYSPAVVAKAREIFGRKGYEPEYRDEHVEILRADFVDERKIPANLKDFLGGLPQDFIVKSIAACENSLNESENDLRPKEYFMHETGFCARTFFPKPFVEKLKNFITARLTKPNPEWKTFQELRDELSISNKRLGEIIADLVRMPIEPEIKFGSYDRIDDDREKQVKFLNQNLLLADHFSPALCARIRQKNREIPAKIELQSVRPEEAVVTRTVIKLTITQVPEGLTPQRFFQIQNGSHKPEELNACRLEIIPSTDPRHAIIMKSQGNLATGKVIIKNHGEEDDKTFEANYWIIERALLEDYTE